MPDRRAKAAAAGLYILGLLAAGLFFCSLAAEQSRVPAVLGRFSWRYAAFLLTAGLALASLIIVTLRWRVRLPEIIAERLSRLPADAVFTTVLAVSGFLSWLYYYPPYSVTATIWFRGGSLLLLLAAAGCLLVRFLVIGLDSEALASLWAFVFGAVVAILLAHFGTSLVRVRQVSILSPLVGYGLLRGASALAAQPPRWAASLGISQLRHHGWLTAGVGVALAGFSLGVYGRAMQHGLLLNDEILWINHVFTHGVAAAILQPATTVFVRPFAQLQAWLDYRLFGFNHAGYVLVQLCLLWLSAAVLFVVAAKLSGNLLVAALLAGLVVVHRFVANLVTVWAIDTVTLTATLAVLVIYWLAFVPSSRSYYVALGVLLLLACLSRENGLVAAGAVGLSAGLRLRQPALEKARAARELAVTLLVLLVYFVLRRWWLGAAVPQQLFIQETCLGFHLFQGQELATLPLLKQTAVIAYTVAANLVAPVVPFIVGESGCLPASGWGVWLPPLVLVLGGTVLCHAIERRLQRQATPAPAAAALGLALLPGIVAGGPILLGSAGALVTLGQFNHLDLWFHGGVTLLVLYCLLRERPTGRAQWLVVANVVGAWLGGALVLGLYFRYRNFYTLLFGWALLVALVWQGLARSSRGRHSVQATLALLLTACLIVSASRVSRSLPLPDLLTANFDPRSLICWPVISNDFAVQWARWYSLDEEVAACRVKERCDPAAWQLPFNYGRAPWAPSPADHCETASE